MSTFIGTINKNGQIVIVNRELGHNGQPFDLFKFKLQVHFANRGIDVPDPNEDCYTNNYEPKRKTT